MKIFKEVHHFIFSHLLSLNMNKLAKWPCGTEQIECLSNIFLVLLFSQTNDKLGYTSVVNHPPFFFKGMYKHLNKVC